MTRVIEIRSAIWKLRVRYTTTRPLTPTVQSHLTHFDMMSASIIGCQSNLQTELSEKLIFWFAVFLFFFIILQFVNTSTTSENIKREDNFLPFSKLQIYRKKAGYLSKVGDTFGAAYDVWLIRMPCRQTHPNTLLSESSSEHDTVQLPHYCTV